MPAYSLNPTFTYHIHYQHLSLCPYPQLHIPFYSSPYPLNLLSSTHSLQTHAAPIITHSTHAFISPSSNLSSFNAHYSYCQTHIDSQSSSCPNIPRQTHHSVTTHVHQFHHHTPHFHPTFDTTSIIVFLFIYRTGCDNVFWACSE